MGLNITRISQREWFLDVRIRRNGREHRRRETFYGTQREAEERYFQIKEEVRRGEPAISKIPSGTFGDILIRYRQRRLVLGGIDETRYACLYRDLGAVSIPQIASSLEAYLEKLGRVPSGHTLRVRTGATINRYVSMARAAFNLAVSLGVIDQNPITKARFPKLKEVPRDKVLAESDVVSLLSATARLAPHLHPLVRFAIQVPCRKSELVHMRREDLDLFNKAIRVRNGTTKNDMGCWKPIPPDMVAYFRSIPPSCPWLFYKVRKGLFLPLGDFKKAWARCMGVAGIKGFRFHDTRHISATTLLDNGTPEQVVLEVAGWKTNMLRTYYHRGGKRSLGLVRFTAGSGHLVDAPMAEAVKTGQFTKKNALNG